MTNGVDQVIVGHRGLGMNTSANTEEDITENTIESFAAATALGISWVEFDLQLTRDNHFVVWHDDEITYRKKHFQVSEGDDNPCITQYIYNITCAEFAEILATTEILRTDEGGHAGVYVWQNAPKELVYFKEVLSKLPSDLLGFNIDLKIPKHHTLNCAFIRQACRTLVDTLCDIEIPQQIVISSFSSIACVELLKLGLHNIMLLTEDDALSNVVQTCIDCGIPGFVAHVSQLHDHEEQLDCEVGIRVWCYGGKHHLATHCIVNLDALTYRS